MKHNTVSILVLQTESVLIPNIDAAKFEELVKDAEANCPVSKLLNEKINVNYQLI